MEITIAKFRETIRNEQNNYDMFRALEPALSERAAIEIVDSATALSNESGYSVSDARIQGVYDFVKHNNIVFSPNGIDPNTGEGYEGTVEVFAKFFLKHGYPETSPEHQLMLSLIHI